jgi:hypothetical protein
MPQINGEVARVEAHSLVLRNMPPLPGGSVEKERSFKVSDATVIVEQVAFKDPKTFNAEMASFQKQMRDAPKAGKPPVPPSAFEEKEISLSALKAGDRVTVTLENANGSDMAAASKIIRQSAAPAVSAPAAPVP